MAIVGSVAALGLLAFIFLKTTTGHAVGENVAGAVTGFIGGIGSGVAAAANDPSVNPLEGFGAWIGGSIYNLTH